MNLKQALHLYCKENNLAELACIVHIALLNYISNFSKEHIDWTNISPLVLNSYIGIGEDKTIDLLSYLAANTSGYILEEYRFNCKNFVDDYGVTIEKDDFVENEKTLDPCQKCDGFHSYSLNIDKVEYGFSGNVKAIQEDLKLSDEDISKELIILNTNEEHVDKIANILVSKLKLEISKQPEAKKGIIKYLHSFREFTSVLADISGDASAITENVVKIGKDASGMTDLLDLLTGKTES